MTTYSAMAAEAVKSARVLQELGDFRGAVNRSYYAVFHAARAALNSVEPSLGDAKKHATTIRRSSQHLVKAGMVDALLSPILTKAFDARLTADYENEAIDTDTATTLVVSAEYFVSEIVRHLKSQAP